MKKSQMHYLNKSGFFAKLQRRYPFDTEGHFSDGRLKRLFERSLSERFGIDRLARVTTRLISSCNPACLVTFNDQIVGWRGVPQNRKFSPLILEPATDLREFVAKHTYFRSPPRHEDNYYVTSPDLNWFVTFCHHGDWHFHGPPELIRGLPLD